MKLKNLKKELDFFTAAFLMWLMVAAYFFFDLFFNSNISNWSSDLLRAFSFLFLFIAGLFLFTIREIKNLEKKISSRKRRE